MNCIELKEHDVFTLDIMYLMDIINREQFKVLRIYCKRFYPRRKIEWLKFWKWSKFLKRHILIDVEFLGNNQVERLYRIK